MADSPSTHGPDGADPGEDGRGARGRFLPGNKHGRGNPLAGRAAKIRGVLLKELRPADARVIARKLIEMAKAGDMAAIRELLDRSIGKPIQSDLMERLEAIEQHLRPRK